MSGSGFSLGDVTSSHYGRFNLLLRAVLAVFLVFAFVPTAAFGVCAASSENAYADDISEQAISESGTVEQVIPDADILPDSDELFAGYVEREFYGDDGISLLGNFGEQRFSGLNLKIYQGLKTAVSEIADGERSSSEIVLTWEQLGIAKTSWTSQDLGVEILGKDPDTGETIIADAAINAAIKTIGYNSADMGTIIRCLLVDCPYEMYWYDKTETGGSSYSLGTGSWSYSGGVLTLGGDGVMVDLRASSHYSSKGIKGTTHLDVSKTSAASAAAKTARQIVKDNEGKSDYQKLVAYRDAICECVSYNDEAADDNYSGGYGNPWQLIYVFDGNPSTNVVCEGYSKAFQYLCDMSTFQDETLACYTVNGNMRGGTTNGGHMWNVVSVDGRSYLVDVTNCDNGMAGYPYRLFMVGASSEVANGEYVVETPEYNLEDSKISLGQEIYYTYDPNIVNLYSESNVLSLSSEDYRQEGETNQYSSSIYGATLTLDGSVGVNFYVDMSSVPDADRESYSMHFAVAGEEKTASFDANATNSFEGSQVYHRFTCSVDARQMTDGIRAQLYKGDTPVSKVYVYSVETYAAHALDDKSIAENDKNLADLLKAMLNYGGYAQTNFGYKDNSSYLANFVWGPEGNPVANVTKDGLSTHVKALSGDEAIAKDLNLSASLLLESETTIRFYLDVAEDQISSYVFTLDGALVTPKVYAGDTSSGKGGYCIEVPNIASSQLDKPYTLAISKGGSSMTLTYSALSYAYDVLNSSSEDAALQNLVKALYLYNGAADTYFGTARESVQSAQV